MALAFYSFRSLVSTFKRCQVERQSIRFRGEYKLHLPLGAHPQFPSPCTPAWGAVSQPLTALQSETRRVLVSQLIRASKLAGVMAPGSETKLFSTVPLPSVAPLASSQRTKQRKNTRRIQHHLILNLSLIPSKRELSGYNKYHKYICKSINPQ